MRAVGFSSSLKLSFSTDSHSSVEIEVENTARDDPDVSVYDDVAG